MRDPDGRQPEQVREDVVGQGAAQVGQDRDLLGRRGLERGDGPARPGMLRVQAGRGHGVQVRVDPDHGEALGIQVAAQPGHELRGIARHHEADVAVRARARRDRVDRLLGIAGLEGQDLEGVPGEDLLGLAEAGLAPVRVDLGRVLAAVDLQVADRPAHRVRDRRGTPLGHQDLAARAGQAGDGMGQDDPRVGQKAAPVAGVMAARAQIHAEVEVEDPARAHEDRRPVRGQARPVRGDEDIGREELLVRGAEFAQAGRAVLLAGLDQQDGVEAQRAALLEDGGQGRDVDAVLALVVGRAAAVPAVALLGQDPGVEARPPLVVVAAHHVAVAVAHHGGQLVALVAARDQEGPAALERVVVDRAVEAERLQDRRHLLGEVTVELRLLRGLLTLRVDGDAARQVGEIAARIEIVGDARDGSFAAHDTGLPWFILVRVRTRHLSQTRAPWQARGRNACDRSCARDRSCAKAALPRCPYLLLAGRTIRRSRRSVRSRGRPRGA